jgi:hypothetical protein
MFNLIQLLGWAETEPAYRDTSLALTLWRAASTGGRLGWIAPGPHRLGQQGPTAPTSLRDDFAMELARAVAALLPACLQVGHERLK